GDRRGEAHLHRPRGDRGHPARTRREPARSGAVLRRAPASDRGAAAARIGSHRGITRLGGNMIRKGIALFALLSSILWAAPAIAATTVEMTWMSIANWYFKIGEKRIMMDAYISRLPGPPFFTSPPAYPGDMYAYTKSGAAVETDSIRKVHDAVLGDKKLDWLLVGHSHWDHSWDTPTWSKMTGAPMIGGISTCFQAEAQGVTGAQCRRVNGGEKISLGDGVTIRVVRFNHSGDDKNPIQHFARELYRAPIPDASG